MNADPFTPKTARKRAAEVLSHVEYRTPIVDGELNMPLVRKQWASLTYAVLHECLESEKGEVRNAVRQVGQQAIGGALPGLLIDTLKDTDLATVVKGYDDTELGTVAHYDVVPPELLRPDVMRAPVLKTQEWAEGKLAGTLYEYGLRDEFYIQLHELEAQVREYPGVTAAEKELVIGLNMMAGHVKLLGLAAELFDNPAIDASIGKNGEVYFELPSGVIIAADESMLFDNKDLLDPRNWQSSINIKDRVHSIKANDETYVLKERKTAMHAHNYGKFGHKPGHTSANEYTVAKHFASLGPIVKGDIELDWERPIGYVNFPDGYEFVVFKHNPAIANRIKPRSRLRQGILSTPEIYQKEYEDIKALYKKKLSIPTGLKTVFSKDDHRELTFEEFAKIKAACMVFEAENLIRLTTLEQGYKNHDEYEYGVGFEVKLGADGKQKLVAIGFDFEYYMELSKWDKDHEQYVEMKRQHKAALSLNWIGGASDDEVFDAACNAMLESMGYQVTPNANEAD